MPLSSSTPESIPVLSRVAVIGAGALGLASAVQLIEGGVSREEVVVYEAREDVGGLWKYDESPGECELVFAPSGQAIPRTQAEKAKPGIVPPTALYRGLRTNLPNEVMAFRGSPFPEGTDIFPTHNKIYDYLRGYADDKDVRRCIRFSALVTRVFHTPGKDVSDEDRWTVESSTGGGKTRETFSHVVIANGHYSDPFIPYVQGLWNYKGKITHSRWWRAADQYHGQTVLVVGSRASGGDICRDLALLNLATPAGSPKSRIFQSTRSPVDDVYPAGSASWTKEVTVVPRIELITRDGTILFSDGTKLDSNGIDHICFATGYNFYFPMCRETDAPWSTHPVTRPRTVQPGAGEDALPPAELVDQDAYQGGSGQVDQLDTGCQMLYLPDPTIAFIGLAYMVVPFRLGETQARLLTRAWTTLHRIPDELPTIVQSPACGDSNRHCVGYPGEVRNADQWLGAIGEGKAKEDTIEGEWPKTDERWIKSRETAKALRQELLGY